MLSDLDTAEKQDYPNLHIRQASLADVHVLASLTLQSFRGAPFWDWASQGLTTLFLSLYSR